MTTISPIESPFQFLWGMKMISIKPIIIQFFDKREDNREAI
jgi:hypothetical protein